MKTIFCPECNAALKVIYSKEKYDGWKRCQSCDHQSYVIVNELGEAQIRSLHSIISELSSRKYSIEALVYMLKHGEVWINDLIFNVGQKANYDLEQLQRYHLINRIRNHLHIKKDMEKDIAIEVRQYLRTQPDWLKDI